MAMERVSLRWLSAVALVVVLVGCSCAVQQGRTKWHQLSEDYTFEDYAREFRKVYTNRVEYEMRRSVFNTKLGEILAHNRGGASWKMGVNRFTDMTERELRSMLGYRKELAFALHQESGRIHEGMGVPPLDEQLLAGLPASVDWREKDIISDVKDQGVCGSCWTFATSETMESYWALKTGELAVLSEQQIASCTPNPNECGGTGGCGGGIPEIAYAQLMSMGGLASEWTYPYLSYQGKDFPCRFSTADTPPVADLQAYFQVTPNNYTSVIDTLAYTGPLAVNVDASAWSNYESGVFTGCDMQAPDLNHVVQLVGYGVDDSSNMPYWLVRNSWAPSWGEDGYIRLYRDTSGSTCGVDTSPMDGTGCQGGPANVTVCGSCGILYSASYPLM